ncbi:PfkB family carbohydrate kinase [Actinoplanes sp. M2I2]|uniref:PfkB family carbohydrate kinase n=1 Tax=Actinoplanes sp. M2I2 TaxID=1734444 RepID=UPI002021326B|nr:PfkB family carbohydrate kinase [Actinoplanes sp. M2I2]
MTRFLVVGESIVDVIVSPSAGDGSADRELPGGSPANVAVGLSRLGHDVSLWTHFGDDPGGDLLRAHLTGAGVDLLSPVTGTTSRAVAELQPDGSARYDFAVTWPSGITPTITADHLHTGSIAALMSPGAADVEHLLRTRGPDTTASYDPNIRPALVGDCLAPVEQLVALGDVVKASDEDLAHLYPGVPALDVARRWLTLGPSLVAVTLGAYGAFAVAADAHVIVPPVPVTVVDTVGAGDAFMSGLLDALWQRGLLGPGARPRLKAVTAADLHDVVSRAALVAGLTVARAGAAPPTRKELWLEHSIPGSKPTADA